MKTKNDGKTYWHDATRKCRECGRAQITDGDTWYDDCDCAAAFHKKCELDIGTPFKHETMACYRSERKPVDWARVVAWWVLAPLSLGFVLFMVAVLSGWMGGL